MPNINNWMLIISCDTSDCKAVVEMVVVIIAENRFNADIISATEIVYIL